MDASAAAAAKAAVQAAYGSMAARYNEWVLDRPMTRGLFEEFVAALAGVTFGGRTGVRVLDVASASGEPAATLARSLGPSVSVLATDLTPQMVELAEARCARLGLPNLACARADAEALPFADASFDAVTCCMGIMFVPDPAAALLEFARVLRPGGLVGLSVFQGFEWQPFYDFMGQLAAEIAPPAQAGESQPGEEQQPQPFSPCRFADPAPLLEAAVAAGLGGVQCRELRLSYFLAAHEWWQALCLMPDSPVQPALDRARAAAAASGRHGGKDGSVNGTSGRNGGSSGSSSDEVESGARRLAERMLREHGWLQGDGSVLCPDNLAWFITASKL